jgi:DNA-3-methyladenine glycosylase II
MSKRCFKAATCSVTGSGIKTIRTFEAICEEAREFEVGGEWNLETALKHLVDVEPRFKPWVCQAGLPVGFMRSKHEGSYFVALVRTITFQQVSIAAGKSIFLKVLNAFRCEDFEALTPELVRDAVYSSTVVEGKVKQTINGEVCGLSEAKVKYLRSLSKHFLDPALLAGKDLHKLPESEVFSKLVAVDGLGNWSAHMFLIHKLQRQNVIAVGDLGVKKGIAKMYGLSDASWKKMKEPQFLELVKHWHPYGSLGSALMWKADEVTLEEGVKGTETAAVVSTSKTKKQKSSNTTAEKD